MSDVGLSRLWSVDRDAKRVGAAMLVGLILGAMFVIFGTPNLPSAWAGLLWAAACSAVGWFIGFLFGIPRTLSSDTARTTLPTQNEAEDLKTKAAASRRIADDAAAKKVEADSLANTLAEKLKTASAKAEAAQNAVDNAPGDTTLSTQAENARKDLEKTQAEKKDADAKALEKAITEKRAKDQAEADEVVFAAHSNRDNAPPLKSEISSGPSTAVNTNLEQISDWLTKIIVGVTLVNIDSVAKNLETAASFIGKSLGGAEPESFALAILIYFSTTGLLGSYLLTRLFLQRAFSDAGFIHSDAR